MRCDTPLIRALLAEDRCLVVIRGAGVVWLLEFSLEEEKVRFFDAFRSQKFPTHLSKGDDKGIPDRLLA